MKIALMTADGDLVHEEEIPDFEQPPLVILWGTRVFSRSEFDLYVYLECFAYALP